MTDDLVKIRPARGKQQETAALLLAAAQDPAKDVLWRPPHFIVPRTVAIDAGLLEESEEPPAPVVLHDRTMPFPPLYPEREGQSYTPLAPPGEQALAVTPVGGEDPGQVPGVVAPADSLQGVVEPPAPEPEPEPAPEPEPEPVEEPVEEQPSPADERAERVRTEVAALTVEQVAAALDAETYTKAEVRAAELAGKNRKGVLALTEEE